MFAEAARQAQAQLAAQEAEQDPNEKDVDSDEEAEALTDLFSGNVLEDGCDAFAQQCLERRGLDLCALARGAASEYEWIKAVNFCRREHARGVDAAAIVAALGAEGALADDGLLRPVLADDALLYSYEDFLGAPAEQESAQGSTCQEFSQEQRMRLLEEDLVECRAKMRQLLEECVEAADRDDDDDDDDNDDDIDAEDKEGEKGPKGEKKGEKVEKGSDAGKARKTRTRRTRLAAAPIKDYYFDSYSSMGIHEEMLRDRPRTDTYRQALERVSAGKTVLDIGCGTGILCMFAARYGASRVVGVDASSIVETARRVVALNGLEKQVALERGKVEDVQLDVKADVIVSEWMGYGLLFESMLDSVLVARDRFLAPGGIMVPCAATIFVQAQSDTERFDFWKDVYGFDYGELAQRRPKDALVECPHKDTVVSDRVALKHIDIQTVTKEELDFSEEVRLTVAKDATLSGFVLSFDCDMAPGEDLSLTTAVEAPATHWGQTVLFLDEFLAVKQGQVLSVRIGYKRNADNCRDIDISLSVDDKHHKAFYLG